MNIISEDKIKEIVENKFTKETSDYYSVIDNGFSTEDEKFVNTLFNGIESGAMKNPYKNNNNNAR